MSNTTFYSYLKNHYSYYYYYFIIWTQKEINFLIFKRVKLYQFLPLIFFKKIGRRELNISYKGMESYP